MFILLCAACSHEAPVPQAPEVGLHEEIQQGIQHGIQIISDPQKLLYAFVSVVGSISLILHWLGGQSVWSALLNGLRYTGALSATLSPLYYLKFGNQKASIALAAAGLIAFVFSTYLVWEARRHGSTQQPVTVEDDEDED